MNNRVFNKKLLVFILMILFVACLNCSSNAASGTKSFNNAPRMVIKTNSSKFADVNITFIDYSGLDSSNIKFYSVKDDTKKEIDSKDFIKEITPTYSKDDNTKIVKYTYTIKNKYLNQKSHKFYVEVVDKNKSDCTLKTYFRIVAKKNRYKVDYAPRIRNFVADGKNFTFISRDMAGTKTLKVYDLYGNSPSKEIYKNKKTLSKGNAKVRLDLSKFTEKDGKYKMKIVAVDNASANLKATRVINFAVSEAAKKEKEENEEKEKIAGEGITIDREILMIDNKHYNFADLEVKLGKDSGYTKKDVTWTVGDKKVAILKKNGKKEKKIKGYTKMRVYGVGFGDTTVTASLPNGQKAACKVKVIVSTREYVEGDMAAKPVTEWLGTQFETHYHREGNPYYIRKKSVNWGKEYVEAYINNAAKLVKEYQDSTFKSEAKKRTIYTYKQSDLTIHYSKSKERITKVVAGHNHGQTDGLRCGKFKEIVMTKKKGELSPNGYLFFFTTKNQWEYLLKLEDPSKKWNEKTNRWKVLDVKKSSAGHYRDRFEDYCNEMYCNNGDNCYLLSMRWTGKGTKNDNSCGSVIHNDFFAGTRYHGVPSSHGCIHLGTYKDRIYYNFFVKAGLGTRCIVF